MWDGARSLNGAAYKKSHWIGEVTTALNILPIYCTSPPTVPPLCSFPFCIFSLLSFQFPPISFVLAVPPILMLTGLVLVVCPLCLLSLQYFCLLHAYYPNFPSVSFILQGPETVFFQSFQSIKHPSCLLSLLYSWTQELVV